MFALMHHRPRTAQRYVKHMNKPVPSYKMQQFAKFLLWSMVLGAVVEYGFFCVSTGISSIWIAIGLLCCAVVIPCSHRGLRRLEVFLTHSLARRLESEERPDA